MSHCVYHIEEIVSSSEFNHTGVIKKMTVAGLKICNLMDFEFGLF